MKFENLVGICLWSHLTVKGLTVLTAKVRAVFVEGWGGDSRFKLQFLVILVWLSEIFLKDVFK